MTCVRARGHPMLRQCLAVSLPFLLLSGCIQPAAPEPAAAAPAALVFEPNVGQAASDVAFIARSLGSTYVFGTDGFRTADGAALLFEGATPVVPTAGNRLAGHTNLYLGTPDQWHEGIPHHDSLLYEQLWPGVDIRFYSQSGRLEYDVLADSPAALSQARLTVDGGSLAVRDGSLVVSKAGSESVHTAPIAWQTEGATVDVRYVLLDHDTFGFAGEGLAPDLPIVVDPVILDYSSYAGGTQGEPWGGVANWNGVTTIAGTSFAGAGFPGPPVGGPTDAFLLGYDPLTGTILFVTLFGGSADESFTDIVAGDYGFATAGWTASTNMPVSAGAAQTLPGGGNDGFVATFSPAGMWTASTYLGGAGDDQAWGVASRKPTAPAQFAATGWTKSLNFPVTLGAHDLTGPLPFERDAFASVLTPAMGLVHSTYLGGTDLEWGEDVSFQENGGMPHIALVGTTQSANYPTTLGSYQTVKLGLSDAYVALIDPTASGPGSLTYSSFLGGLGNERGQGVALTPWGSITAAGAMDAGPFPTTPGAFQPIDPGNGNGFLSEIVPGGAGVFDLVYSTYLGGFLSDGIIGFHEAGGMVYVTGATISPNFPVSAGAFQPAIAGNADIFLTSFHHPGLGMWGFAWSTYFGGADFENSHAVYADRKNNVAVLGLTADMVPTFPMGAAPPFQPMHAGGASLFDYVVFNAHCDPSWGPC